MFNQKLEYALSNTVYHWLISKIDNITFEIPLITLDSIIRVLIMILLYSKQTLLFELVEILLKTFRYKPIWLYKFISSQNIQ